MMWDFLSGLVMTILTWFGALLDNMAQAIVKALEGIGDWFSETFGDVFQALTSFLSTILQPALDLVGGLLYLLFNLVDVLILVVHILLLLVQVLLGIIGGLFRSFAALSQFDPASVTPDRNPFGAGTSLIFDVFGRAGGDVVAAVLSWAVWFVLAVAVIRLFARERATS